MHKAYKFRLFPNEEQTTLINKTFGCVRYVFNHFLAKRKELYESEGKTLNYNACSASLTELKQELKWLKDVDSLCLQQELKNLDESYKRFFTKQNSFPRFKSKRDSRRSYKTAFQSKNQSVDVSVEGNKIKLPKLGWVRFAKSREIIGRMLSATISKNPSGKYFVSVLCEVDIQPLPQLDKVIGVDLGTTYFAITSDGTFYENPRYLRKYSKKLEVLQRKMSRKYEQAKKDGRALVDSKNYQKNKLQVARLHEHITNCRTDYLQKLSTKLINENQVIKIEDLQVSNMVKNHNLARSISDASWASFRTMLEYKANWYGRTVIAVNPMYTSQACHKCGHVSKENRKTQAEFACVQCGHMDNADVNAAKNIRDRVA